MMSFPKLQTMIIFALSIPTVACHDYTLHSFEPTNEGAEAQLDLNTPSLDFGIVDSEVGATRSFEIKNIGKADLEIEGLILDGEDAASFILMGSNTGFVLPAGASQEIEILMYGSEKVDMFAQAIIFSNDRLNPVETVSLFGESAIPDLDILPNPLNMGEGYIGCDTSSDVILQNNGTKELIIHNIVHSNEAFSVIDQPTLPVALEPGAFTSITLQFSPEQEEQVAGLLTVESNDPRENGVQTAAQFGSGKIIDEHIETWENPIDPPTDIIFSVDLSCSMQEDAAQLASNFDQFINELSNYSNNWQIIVANHDSGCNNSGILTPQTPNYQDKFFNAVTDINQRGSYTERLLTIVRNAVDKTDPTECNANFLRPEAMLHVVMLSDEPERSSGSKLNLVNQIAAKKGDINYLRMSAIAGMVPSSTCGTAWSGTGYWDAVNATSGVFLDFCSNWSSPSNLELLAETSVLIETYPLEEPAIEDTISVFINESSISAGWYFDEELNAVVFDEDVIQEGDSVSFEYGERAVCDPL